MRRTPIIVAAALAFGPALAQQRVIDTQSGRIKVETLTDKLENPWGLAFLEDRRMLVTERPGRLRIVTTEGTVSRPLSGVPRVLASGQGGLLDVALDPDFAANRLVYLSYAEPGQGGASTAVARGRLGEDGLTGLQVIFRQQPKLSDNKHFGSRLVFTRDGKLFITTGERFQFQPAQDLSNHLGKVLRINRDGSVPEDNPFVGRQDAKPEIWSYGHRNSQGAALHPQTGVLWESEHGPRGGDEINIPQAGKNYGWPGELGQSLQWTADPKAEHAAGPRRLDLSMDAGDRGFRHGFLHGRCVSRLARQPAGRRAGVAWHCSSDVGWPEGHGRRAHLAWRPRARRPPGPRRRRLRPHRRRQRQDFSPKPGIAQDSNIFSNLVVTPNYQAFA
jgi:glucose/arabinose dehydrogenase